MTLSKDRESETCRKIFKVLLQRLSLEDFKRICDDAEEIAQESDIPFKEFVEFLERVLEEIHEKNFLETGITIKLNRSL